jgi:tRNA threonylcarbamoyladenosine biosynthesis protein TsaB
MKTILAIETSTAGCSVGLLHQNKLTEKYELLPQKHAQRVLMMVDELLKETEIQGSDIDYLAFGEGPGAFTGVRIAAGVIQGLALGWQKPVVGISSLEAMVYPSVMQRVQSTEDSDKEPIKWVAMMDARMQEVYFQHGEYWPDLQKWHARPAELLTQTDVHKRLCDLAPLSQYVGAGDIQALYPDLTSQFKDWQECLPMASAVVQLVSCYTGLAETIQQRVPLPRYLRNNVAETIEQRRKHTQL